MKATKKRKALTLVELVVVIIVIGIMACMLLPATRSTRESARRIDCANRLRQLTLSAHRYHDARRHFPSVMGDPDLVSLATPEGAKRLNAFVLLLPYMEAKSKWQELITPLTANGISFPAGPAPWVSGYPLWKNESEDYLCPTTSRGSTEFAPTNYAFCIGDMARGIYRPSRLRGAFAVGHRSRLEDIPDGTSRTIAMAEISRAMSDDSVKGNIAINQLAEILDRPELWKQLVEDEHFRTFKESTELGPESRGDRWADGAAEMSLFNTVLRPGAGSIAIGGSKMVDGIYSADSFHPAGVNVAFMDGSVRNISRDIEAGDASQPTLTIEQLKEPGQPTPYGVWGQLGVIDDGAVPLHF